MSLCQPIIGVVLAMPDQTVEIGYYSVTSDNFPKISDVLDVLMALLGYADVELTSDAKVLHYEALKCRAAPLNGVGK